MSHIPHGLLYALAFVAALTATLSLTPRVARLARRLGIMDLPASNKFHKEATPYLGGLAVTGALVLVGGVAAGTASAQLMTILVGGIALALLGLADDVESVRLPLKLLVEMAAAVALWVAGIRAGLFHVYVLDLVLTVLWVVAITNSMNLIDNMDGLSSGVTALAALAFFAAAAETGDYLVASFAIALAGASLGFLRHNFPPAKIFLGDAGSLSAGFLLAAIGLKLDLVGPTGLVRAAVPLLILGVPVFDTVLVIVSRLWEGRLVYVGGTDHTSHRLAQLGHSNRAVAISIYCAQLACAGVGLLLHHSSGAVAMWLLLAVLLVAVLALLGLLVLTGKPAASERNLVEPLPSVAGGL